MQLADPQARGAGGRQLEAEEARALVDQEAVGAERSGDEAGAAGDRQAWQAAAQVERMLVAAGGPSERRAAVSRQAVEARRQVDLEAAVADRPADDRLAQRAARLGVDPPAAVLPERERSEVAATGLEEDRLALAELEPPRALLVIAERRLDQPTLDQLHRRALLLDRRSDVDRDPSAVGGARRDARRLARRRDDAQ